jgi:fructose-1,6-bisphosphatase I
MNRLSHFLEASHTSADLNRLIISLATTGKEIARNLQLGAMAGILGDAHAENVQGEEQKKLDVIANDLLKSCLQESGVVRALASEEEEDIVACSDQGNYLVAYDPLDGSSNIDINSMVGTIFSIYQAPAYPTQGDHPATADDFLQPGRNQIAAGYILYGPSVMLVLTTGNGVSMFTLDQSIGEYILTTAAVTIGRDTKEFAINMSNQRFWAPAMQGYIAELLAGNEGKRGKNFNMRWVAAMVADVHRILCRGGIFSYPWDSKDPNKPGKLRLMYEANPMAMLIEQAGGEAWTDKERILDVQPEKIHQRVPVILGSANEVLYCIDCHK